MAPGSAYCPICFERKPKTFRFQCGHWYCASCSVKCAFCPMCNSPPIPSSNTTQDNERAEREGGDLGFHELRHAENLQDSSHTSQTQGTSNELERSELLDHSTSEHLVEDEHWETVISSRKTGRKSNIPSINNEKKSSVHDVERRRSSTSALIVASSITSSNRQRKSSAVDEDKRVTRSYHSVSTTTSKSAPKTTDQRVISSRNEGQHWSSSSRGVDMADKGSSSRNTTLANMVSADASYNISETVFTTARNSKTGRGLSYLAATSMTGPDATTFTPQPVSPLSQTASESRRKNKSSSLLQIDLLQMAYEAKRRDDERKRQLGTQQHSRTGVKGVQKGNVPSQILRGKVRGQGEIARRKNRLSSLKKAILKERRAKWFLSNPELETVPFTVHPGLIDFDCVWLEQTENLCDEDEINNSTAESQGRVNRCQSLGDDSASSSNETDDQDSDDTEMTGDGSDINESSDLTSHYEQNEATASDAGTVGFDPFVYSPVFFGATFKRRQSVHNSALLKSTKDCPSLPLARPVRNYVSQALSKELDELVISMVSTLLKYQDRARHDDPIKSKLRRRIVMGLREVHRGVRSRKCIAVVITSNIEDISGLDEKVNEIIELCSVKPENEQNELWVPIPLIFSTSKRALAKSLGKRSSVSCVGIYSADGAHEQFKECLALSKQLTDFWKHQVEKEREEALNGSRPKCAGQCGNQVLDIARRTCYRCHGTFCEPCASKRAAKSIPCAFSKPQDNQKALCQIVRIVRMLPPLEAKPLSASAAEFVPSWLQHS